MLIIKPVQEKETQKEFCDACAIEYQNGMFAYAAFDNGNFIGMSQFNLEENCGYIRDLTLLPGLDDSEALFILGRATMNFIDTCGAHQCRAYPSEAPIFRAIGFRMLANGEWFCDMSGMFDSKCAEHKHK